MRYTKSDAIKQVKRLCNVLGKEYGHRKGNYCLDSYNGYMIVEIGENGTHSNVFGYERHSAKEIYHLCNFAMRAIALDRLDGKESAAYWPNNKCDIN